MAKMVDALDGEPSATFDSSPSNAGHVVPAAPAAGGLSAPIPSMGPGIMIVLQGSGAAGSLVEIVAQLRCFPTVPKVVLLVERASDTMDIAKLNVDGVILSSPQVRTFLTCIESVADGRRWVDPDVQSLLPAQRMNLDCLTLREREIVEGVVRGLRNKEIAREMRLRESTVKMHLHHIFEKLKLASRTQLALACSAPDKPNGR